MNIAAFIAKWRKGDLKERSAVQEHFLDLCNHHRISPHHRQKISLTIRANPRNP